MFDINKSFLLKSVIESRELQIKRNIHCIDLNNDFYLVQPQLYVSAVLVSLNSSDIVYNFIMSFSWISSLFYWRRHRDEEYMYMMEKGS